MELGEGLPPGARWRAMATIAIAISMAVLDGAIANIALPTIGHELGALPATTIWVVNGY
jgi:MFS transporter, DHA2 family, multidrug resistance protein